jgi:hypothetical protein
MADSPYDYLPLRIALILEISGKIKLLSLMAIKLARAIIFTSEGYHY